MQPHAHTSSHALLALRVLGAILLLFVGADHFYEYSVDDYSVLPTIGALFLLNSFRRAWSACCCSLR